MADASGLAARLLGGRRQLRHQPQRNRQLVQLEVGPQESDGSVDAGLAGHFRHIDARFAQRPRGLYLRATRYRRATT